MHRLHCNQSPQYLAVFDHGAMRFLGPTTKARIQPMTAAGVSAIASITKASKQIWTRSSQALQLRQLDEREMGNREFNVCNS
jgi:hypothetical protein